MVEQAPRSLRLKIRRAVSGNIVCFPGPVTAENAWSVPANAFDVQNLVGSTIIIVCEETNTLSKDTYLVSAVLTRGGEIAPRSYSLDEVATNGWVSILTGASVLPSLRPQVCGKTLFRLIWSGHAPDTTAQVEKTINLQGIVEGLLISFNIFSRIG